MKLVETSYDKNDVTVLLKDITGLVEPLDTLEREKLNQSGVHYSEMLPVEYVPSEEYINMYHSLLKSNATKTAKAVISLGDKILKRKQSDITLISLARAGTPIGILLKRYLKMKHRENLYLRNVFHFSLSIIRGKGLDMNAIEYIKDSYGVSEKSLVFVDGWIGKGAIQKELLKSIKDNKMYYTDGTLNVLSDPSCVVGEEYSGTREDFTIPSSCLNSTVSGLFSRTFRDNGKVIGKNDFDGAISYIHLKDEDLSLNFIETIWTEICNIIIDEKHTHLNFSCDIVRRVQEEYNVKDVNKIKPGIGETTRVLLRRIPKLVLIDEKYQFKSNKEIEGIIQLCKEKNVKIDYYDLGETYAACGIIDDVADL